MDKEAIKTYVCNQYCNDLSVQCKMNDKFNYIVKWKHSKYIYVSKTTAISPFGKSNFNGKTSNKNIYVTNTKADSVS